ncbi:GntR family transcriptional regulator [Pseudotabrizicola alkalilacus]|uniref:GntR family transcriptional regulator n=1 Tax=Pseudotabrizicola alkalilacus TaxID=2305252 RepID=A0A411YYN0_9RHOB|nr:GntR family transcriptional regulator [Pseudotabrizicola alkalilacus]RGP35880.1 GntR family transcriptional regulator [Pseudotabrizicola alkalilacus]
MGIAASRTTEKVASVRPVSVVDGVYNNIYERLMSLEIAPRARIPIDVIARDLNVSQTPVREALSRLEREGLVLKEHLIGYSAAPQLTRKQFDDLYTFRLLLEPEGARLAAVNMTPDALKLLEEAAADMGHGAPPVDRTSRYSRFARADAYFHDAILKVAGNDVIQSTLFNQHVHLHIFRLMFHTRVTQEALEEHENLLAAFRAGDAVAAETAMREHILRSRDRLLSAFE